MNLLASSKAPRLRVRVAALVICDGQILLAQHEKANARYYLLPGGGLEPGERLEQALQRELHEEAGMDITVGDLLWVVNALAPDRSRHIVNLIFAATTTTKSINVTTDAVLRDVVWVPLDEIHNLPVFPDIRTELFDYLETGTIARVALEPAWVAPPTPQSSDKPQ